MMENYSSYKEKTKKSLNVRLICEYKKISEKHIQKISSRAHFINSSCVDDIVWG